MCWLTNACPSTTSVMVFFKSAPRARIGRLHRKHSHCARRVPASAAKHGRAENSGASNRIIHAPRDRTLADQESIGDFGKAVQRFDIVEGNRFARTVRARHHQHFRRARCEEQMMKRRIRQHHAEFVIVGRHAGRFDFAGAITMGRAGGRQKRFRFGRNLDERSSDVQILRHQREWLFLAIFSIAQSLHGIQRFWRRTQRW